MNRNIVFALLLPSLLTAVADTTQAEPWPGWRGPRTDGTTIEKNIAANWDPAVAVWKTKLPGKGHASPIVWGDYVCTTTGVADSTERILLCLDRNSGKILWQQTVVKGPLEKLHKENSLASGTPVTDGKRVFVVFRVGDNLIAAAYDLATGKQLWQVPLGKHKGMWGFSNSPVLFKDKVIIDGDGEDYSFLIALSRDDGKTLWRNDRTNKGPSYSAPFIRKLSGKVQMIQCGDRCVTSFDPDTGEQLWTVDGPSEQFVTTPVYSEKAGLIFVSSSWPKTKLLAIRPDGKGNVTKTHVAWSDTKGAPYVPSMIVAEDFLISVNRGGNAFCYEAATGQLLWKEKLGRHHASPVLIDGLAFFINDDGQVNVIKPGKKFERVATYQIGEPCYASPAISDGQVFVRGFEHLFCFGKQAQ